MDGERALHGVFGGGFAWAFWLHGVLGHEKCFLHQGIKVSMLKDGGVARRSGVCGPRAPKAMSRSAGLVGLILKWKSWEGYLIF